MSERRDTNDTPQQTLESDRQAVASEAKRARSAMEVSSQWHKDAAKALKQATKFVQQAAQAEHAAKASRTVQSEQQQIWPQQPAHQQASQQAVLARPIAEIINEIDKYVSNADVTVWDAQRLAAEAEEYAETTEIYVKNVEQAVTKQPPNAFAAKNELKWAIQLKDDTVEAANKLDTIRGQIIKPALQAIKTIENSRTSLEEATAEVRRKADGPVERAKKLIETLQGCQRRAAQAVESATRAARRAEMAVENIEPKKAK